MASSPEVSISPGEAITTWKNWFSTHWTILKICLEERLVYRGDFALGTLMRFLPIVTQIFLWSAVFSTLPSTNQNGEAANIQGYTYHQFVAYYLLTMISRAFSSMPGLASGIAKDIREGAVNKYLIQPIDMMGFLFLNRVAHKLVYYLMAAAPFALVFFLCRDFFSGWPPTETLLLFFLSLIFAFLLGFLIEATIGLIGFWFLEVGSLLFIYMLLNFFFSGHMFPIDMLPGFWRTLVELIPLHYLAYFPAAVFLGQIEGDALYRALFIEACWIIALLFINRIAFYYGVRRYSGYGG
ncbi:ABC transporter permease [Planctomycetales bacterium 10988]|nr:ABC transporter permease [Planctomycetales bacterium 10988]